MALNPYEFKSAVVSAIGSSANLYSVCIALSFIVGMLRGLFLPFFFGIYTLFKGCGLYPLSFNFPMALYFVRDVSHNSPSIPLVFLPLFSVILFTAKAFA